jgi:nicotinamidase-related amidase
MASDRYVAPDFGSAVLVTIDVQRDVLDGGAIEIPGTSAILPRLQTLVEAFRSAGRPIVHVVRLYEPGGHNADLCRRALLEGGRRLLTPGSDGAELAAELRPEGASGLNAECLLRGELQRLGPAEAVLYKPRWSAFYETPLEANLRSLDVSTLVLAGCNFPNCPRATLFDASCRDFRLVLATDAVSRLEQRDEVQLTDIGVALLETKDVIAALPQAAKPVA